MRNEPSAIANAEACLAPEDEQVFQWRVADLLSFFKNDER
jgi:hypothetical protein